MEFFSSKDNNIGEKRDVAFQTVVGIRDAVSIATRKSQPPTYEQSLRLIHDLDPDLYETFNNILSEKNDSDLVKYFKEEAALQTQISGKTIDASELMSKEIKRLNNLMIRAQAKNQDIKNIKRRIAQLYSGIENLKPRSFTENAILVRDFSQLDRSFLGDKIISEYKYVDYALPRDRFLRLRLLHPDKEEHISGADLLYEQYNLKTNQVRFLFLQYKTWDDGIIYFSQHQNLIPQLKKMEKMLCNSKCCDSPDQESDLIDFRMPYCSGFLRPTDKLQHEKAKMVSSGLHIPICNAIQLSENNLKLEKIKLKDISPNHYIFEKLFNLNLVGSRWMDIYDVEDFYKEKGILDSENTIKIYAREIIKDKLINFKEYDGDELPF